MAPFGSGGTTQMCGAGPSCPIHGVMTLTTTDPTSRSTNSTGPPKGSRQV